MNALISRLWCVQHQDAGAGEHRGPSARQHINSGPRSSEWTVGLPDPILFFGVAQDFFSELEIVKITMTILCFCRLVHQMQVIETGMISQDIKRIESQPWPQLNSIFGIAEHQNLGLKPFFGGQLASTAKPNTCHPKSAAAHNTEIYSTNKQKEIAINPGTWVLMWAKAATAEAYSSARESRRR